MARARGNGRKKSQEGQPDENVHMKVRMYRHGLGDCILLTLPRSKADGGDYYVLIDCGVILGTPSAQQLMTDVMNHIRESTHDRVDLLIATHEHWDHVSGFIQAREVFKNLRVDEVWLAWTEDPADELGRKLCGERSQAVDALRMSVSHLEAFGADEIAADARSLVEFFGVAGGMTTRDALEAVRSKSTNLRYCDPADKPRSVPGTNIRIYVLGPPRNERFIKRVAPSKREPETYELAAAAFRDHVPPILRSSTVESPFSTLFGIPWPVAQATEFFQRQYWNGEGWRQIDAAWLDGTSALALALDSATNNTSLVIALEIGDSEDSDVVLFAADAQVGNWLSWSDLSWDVDGRKVTGPDLLRRTKLYKVGHHGSHNATLREKGLEMMESLEYALVPVDQAMAKKKRWGAMPLPGLLDALQQRAKVGVFRSDRDAAIAGLRQPDPRYFEISL